MARPYKQTVDYFPHDAHANNSDTLTILQGRWGNDGYAFWFRLLEKLSGSEGHFIDCRNPVKWQLLLAKTQLTEEIGTEIMGVLVELDAIDPELWLEHRVIWCQNLVNNIAEAYKNRRRPIPVRPVFTTRKPNTTDNNPITTGDKPQTKLKETKLKETYTPYPEYPNVNKITRKEHQQLIESFGEAEAKSRVKDLSLYIASMGDKYKSHYATILNWHRREQKEGGQKDGKHQGYTARRVPQAYTDPKDA